MNGALLKRLVRKNKGDVVHSSGFASVQNCGAMGSASTESFQKRREIDNNRTIVRSYSDSGIVNKAWGNASRIKVKKPVGNIDRFSRETPVSRAQAERAKRDARFGVGGAGQKSVGGINHNNIGGAGQNKPTPPLARKNPGFYR